MRRTQKATEVWPLGLFAGGMALVGGAALLLAAWPKGRKESGTSSEPVYPLALTEVEVEAAARMLASENPRGSRQLHIEQVFTQLRARKKGQSLYERITAGSGWGAQGKRASGGGVRPVSTAAPATPELRQLAHEVLSGLHDSVLAGARKFFEPAQQDRAYAVAERARNKQAAGGVLTPAESRLLGYRHTAQEIRDAWKKEGARFLGNIDGIEFYG